MRSKSGALVRAGQELSSPKVRELPAKTIVTCLSDAVVNDTGAERVAIEADGVRGWVSVKVLSEPQGRDRAPRAAAAPAFANGALVTVAGLVSKAAHNGRSGDVLRWLPDKGRYEVMLKPDGDLASTLISLKPANLVIAS